MKQKDIALIVVVGVISIVVSTIVSNLIFSTQGAKAQSAEVVQAINPSFTEPDRRYFNADSVDPTELIRIGDNVNQTPFQQSNQ